MLQGSAADRFLGTAASTHWRHEDSGEHLHGTTIHPLDIRYRVWWYITVLIAAITGILEPYTIAFTPPGLYPYNSATSILEFVCIGLIVIDMAVSFNVARYVDGELIVNRRQLAKNYLRCIFWIDLISVIPVDEIALAIAGLNGPKYVDNPILAQYLSLFKLLRMLRMYRVSWFFSYLTHNLAAPLLLVTLSRNVFLTFFLANLSACAFYFEALQQGLGPNTWVGAAIYPTFQGTSTADMYIYSLYWSVVTLSTTGYGDIHAYNPVEAGLIIFWLLFVFFFTAYIIGSITLLVVKGDERMGKYREDMRALQCYATLHSLPPKLRDSMQRHLKLHFYNQTASDETVLKVYPSSIRRRVLRCSYFDHLARVYLFKGTKHRFLEALLGSARVELYLPHVDIISEGDHVTDLFVIISGQVQCRWVERGREEKGGAIPRRSSSSFVLRRKSINDAVSTSYTTEDLNDTEEYKTKRLGAGDAFGEVAFFTGTPHIERVTTMVACRVLAIEATTYDKIAASFQSSARTVLTNLSRAVERATLSEFTASDPQLNAEECMSSCMSNPNNQRSITARQAAALGTMSAVRQVVARAVARHDADRTTAFLYAAARGDCNEVKEMISNGTDPNTADYDSRTAIMLAAARGFTDLIQLLLCCGADPNCIDAFGGSALWEACRFGHEGAITALLAGGAVLGRDDLSTADTLCTAVYEGDIKLLCRLLRAGADVDAADYDGRTALHIAASQSSAPAVRALLDRNPATSARDRWGNTPLDDAKRVAAQEIITMLETHMLAC